MLHLAHWGFSIQAHAHDNFEDAFMQNFSVAEKQIIKQSWKVSSFGLRTYSNGNGKGVY